VPLKVTPTAAGTVTIGTQVKQSNNFSGTGNDFILLNSSGLTINVVALSLMFHQQPPSTVMQSLPNASPPYYSYFCASVQLLYNGNLPFPASGIPVTIRYAGTADPGLYNGGLPVAASGITVPTNVNGLATFCGPGLAATIVGSGYALSASSPAAPTPVMSSSFAVTPTCSGSCTTNLTSQTTGTTAAVSATDPGGVFQVFASFGQGVTLNCDTAVTTPGSPVDPLVTLAQPVSGTVSGTLTMTFPKSVVNSLTNNGTPLMPVCAGASKQFPVMADASNGPAPYLYQGLLYDCTDPTYLSLISVPQQYPLQLCVQSRAKIGRGAETIVIYASDLSDPSFW
jgi:hypothetical protein